MHKILVVYAHPHYQQSRLNNALIQRIQGLPGVTLSNLYEQYPDGKINIAQEQQWIEQSNLLILQFPFYWFNTTPLLKKWIDEVFLYGFAYGEEGDKVKGKDLMVTTSIGSTVARYNRDSGFTIPELLKPFEYTAHYCEMFYQSPFIVEGSNDDTALANQAEQYAVLLQDYVQRGAVALRDRKS